MKRFLLPLFVFVGLLGFFYVALHRDPHEIPSPLIGKPAPAFSVSDLSNPTKTVSPKDYLGKVWILNVWASWCAPCREEHPVWVQFSQQHLVPFVGLNYKDQRKDGNRLLSQLGNPYEAIGFDENGYIGIDYGVTGVPETYVIDKKGIIRFKYALPVTPEFIQTKLLPLIQELNRE